jgi:hypothetical protein
MLMDEPFDTRVVLLSALWEGTGQMASGRTTKGLVLFVVGTIFSVLGGVKGTMLKLLTFGRRPIKALPDRLNPLALVWLAIYLYSLYDAYNIASGATEDDADLLDYEEYEPQESDLEYGGPNGATAAPTPVSATAQADHGEHATGTGAGSTGTQAGGAGLANPGNNVAALGQDADQVRGDNQAATGGSAAATDGGANGGQGAPAPAPTRPSGVDLSGAGLDWQAGVTKAQLMDALGDDEQVRGVFGQYLPSDRVFHSADEALTLIPVQAWQSAQGREWTGGDMPTTDEPSGYPDSAAGRMPPGDQSAGTVH